MSALDKKIGTYSPIESNISKILEKNVLTDYIRINSLY